MCSTMPRAPSTHPPPLPDNTMHNSNPITTTTALQKHVQDYPADGKALVALAHALFDAGMDDQGMAAVTRATRLLLMQYNAPFARCMTSVQKQHIVATLRDALQCQVHALKPGGCYADAVAAISAVLSNSAHPLHRDAQLGCSLYDLLCDTRTGHVLAKEWAALIDDAQHPHLLITARDGRLLRPVMPISGQMHQDEVQDVLQKQMMLDTDHPLCCMHTAAWLLVEQQLGRLRTDMRRAAVALMRAIAYHAVGKHVHAAKDIKVALVYGPRASANQPAWALALVVQTSIQQAMGSSNLDSSNVTSAALSMAQALECDVNVPINRVIPDTQRAAWHAMMRNVQTYIPHDASLALGQGGAAGLRVYMDKVAHQALPLYLGMREGGTHDGQFAHYNEWMRGRIVQQLGDAATVQVVDGLLGMDAVDLDLLLQGAERGDAHLLQQRVLAIEGGCCTGVVAAQSVLELTWDEVCELKDGKVLCVTGE